MFLAYQPMMSIFILGTDHPVISFCIILTSKSLALPLKMIIMATCGSVIT